MLGILGYQICALLDPVMLADDNSRVNNFSYYFLIISITTVYFNQRNEMKNIEKNIGMIDRVIRIIL
jgi:hypothetical protein